MPTTLSRSFRSCRTTSTGMRTRSAPRIRRRRTATDRRRRRGRRARGAEREVRGRADHGDGRGADVAGVRRERDRVVSVCAPACTAITEARGCRRDERLRNPPAFVGGRGRPPRSCRTRGDHRAHHWRGTRRAVHSESVSIAPAAVAQRRHRGCDGAVEPVKRRTRCYRPTPVPWERESRGGMRASLPGGHRPDPRRAT